eukprot:892889-Karenia_brevis.AAC.1
MKSSHMPMQVASTRQQISRIPAKCAAKRNLRMRSGQWIGPTEPGQFLARLACHCHPTKDAEQRLSRVLPSMIVRHA